MNKSTKIEKVLDFFAGKGFYIVLAVCVAAIGVSGYALLFGSGSGDIVEPIVSQSAPPSVSAPPSQPAVPSVKPSPSPSPSAPPRMENPSENAAEVISPTIVPGSSPPPLPDIDDKPSAETSPSASPSSKPKPKPVVYVWPVTNPTATVFAPDELVFNETMGDFRAHMGIDLYTDEGASVMSVTDGKVINITEDSRLGVCVVVEHSDGLVSIYGNLGEKPSVIIDQIVSAGDVLGTVGKTAELELAQDSHLHFEMMKDGAQIDPMVYLAPKD